MEEVKSTNLSHVGYDEESKTLTIRFKRGGEYSYHNVPKGIYTALLNAESIGSFFSKFIKDNYRFTKVGK